MTKVKVMSTDVDDDAGAMTIVLPDFRHGELKKNCKYIFV